MPSPMIVSHKHKFIFIKTAKTAGTSIEIALTEICGDEDIITPLSGTQESHRKGRSAQNLELNHPMVPKRPLIRRILRRPERSWHPSVGYYSHIPAWRLRTYLGTKIWNNYFKFTFERNPWDRQVSHYHYKNRNKVSIPKFDKFLARKRRAFVNNFELYSDNGNIIVDFVGRYENLKEDFEKILEMVGQKNKSAVPFVNKSANRQSSYHSYYNCKTRKIVEDWYEPEISNFGYSFEQLQPARPYFANYG